MQPVLFTLPGLDFEVQAYGFFLGLALVLGWGVSLRLAAADRLPAERLGLVYVLTVIAALAAARLLWLLGHPGTVEGWQSILTLRAGTLSPIGGVVAGLMITGVLVNRRGLSVAAWYDALTPAFGLGVVLERLGAFLAGTDFGRLAPDTWFALRFGLDSPAFVEHQRTLGELMRRDALESLPVYPTQLLAAGLGCIGLALCWKMRRHRAFRGQVFLMYGVYYLVARFFVEEPLRADALPGQIGPLNTAQVGAVVAVMSLGFVYYLLRARGAKRSAASTSLAEPQEGGADRATPKHGGSRRTKARKHTKRRGKGRR